MHKMGFGSPVKFFQTSHAGFNLITNYLKSDVLMQELLYISGW